MNFVLLTILFNILFSNLSGQSNNKILIDEVGFFIPAGMYDMNEISYYYSLDIGDTLVSNFSTSKFQGTNVITISAYPSEEIIFYKKDFRRIENYMIRIPKKSVYRFSFATNVNEPVHCKMKLMRIPETSNRESFNTRVNWVTRKDTIFRIYEETVPEGIDTIIESVLDVRQTINKKSVLGIQIPENTVSWYYWIGVGEKSKSIYDEAAKKAHPLIYLINPEVPQDLSPFALHIYKDEIILPISNIGDNVTYWFFEDESKIEEFKISDHFSYPEQGTITTDYGIMSYPLKGSYYIGLSNATSNKEYIDVTVRVVALQVIENYVTKKEKRIYKVKTTRVPVMAK